MAFKSQKVPSLVTSSTIIAPTQRLEHIARVVALVSGLALLAFAAVELGDNAIGLVSLEVMGNIADWQSALIHSRFGSTIVFVAFVSHTATTLWSVARRATLRMSLSDAMQITSGILIPLLLLPYVIDTGGANLLFGVADDTLYRLAKLWPAHAYSYIVLIALLWGHGCLGLHQWLRSRPGYTTFAPVMAVAALALPIAAIAGLIASARVVSVLMADQSFADQVRAATQWPSSDAEARLWHLRLIAVAAYGILLAAIVGALVARLLRIVVAPKIDVTYVNGPTFKASIGPTLLEISRIHSVALADECGGRGRCTACRVRIEQGAASLSPRTATEIAMLGAEDQLIRLACQIRPTDALTVTRLSRKTNAAAAEPDLDMSGTECTVVSLCVRLTDHATFARTRAAYDAIYLLNEFLDAAYAAVVTNNGWVARTTDGGLIAVFGRDGSIEAACRAAVATSASVDIALDRLNERFAAELGRPIAAAIGVAIGPAYLGRVGAGPKKMLTAIGPVIDETESLARQAESRGIQLLSDPAVFHTAGIDANALELLSLIESSATRQVFATQHARLAVHGKA